MPNNGPMTEAGWDPFLSGPKPAPPIVPVTPVGPTPVTPVGPVPPAPPQGGLEEWIRSLTPVQRWVGIVALGTFAYFGVKYIAKETRKGRTERADVPDPEPFDPDKSFWAGDAPAGSTLRSPTYQANSSDNVRLPPMWLRTGNRYNRKFQLV